MTTLSLPLPDELSCSVMFAQVLKKAGGRRLGLTDYS